MSHVQSNSANQFSAGGNIVFGSNVVATHCLLGWFRLSNGSDLITGVSDNINGAWTRVGRLIHTSSSVTSYLYKFPNAAAGATTVTWAAGTSQTVRGIIAEYTESDIDAVVSGLLASGTAQTSGTVTSTRANATIVGYLGLDSGTDTISATGSGNSRQVQPANPGGIVELQDYAGTAAGGYSLSWSTGAAKVTAYYAIAMLAPNSTIAPLAAYNNMIQGL